MPTTSLLAPFQIRYTKTALERLGKPYAIMRSERWTSYAHKDSNGDESNFYTRRPDR